MNQSVLQLQLKILQLKVLIAKASFKIPMDNTTKLYTEAVKSLGKDASPQDRVEDQLACVDSVEQIHYRALGEYICPPRGEISTLRLYQKIKNDPKWKLIIQPVPGALIISPSGMSNKNYKHGHAGIFMLGNTIASNDSRSGLFIENYTWNSWNHVFRDKFGFPVFMFEHVE